MMTLIRVILRHNITSHHNLSDIIPTHVWLTPNQTIHVNNWCAGWTKHMSRLVRTCLCIVPNVLIHNNCNVICDGMKYIWLLKSTSHVTNNTDVYDVRQCAIGSVNNTRIYYDNTTVPTRLLRNAMHKHHTDCIQLGTWWLFGLHELQCEWSELICFPWDINMICQQHTVCTNPTHVN